MSKLTDEELAAIERVMTPAEGAWANNVLAMVAEVREHRAHKADLDEAIANFRALLAEHRQAPAADVAEMVRGLVRCAEFKEQEEDGKIWDDECRRALESARALGWGRHRIGSLGAPALTADEREALRRMAGVVRSIRRQWPEHAPWRYADQVADYSTRVTMTDVEVGRIDAGLAVLSKLLATTSTQGGGE